MLRQHFQKCSVAYIEDVCHGRCCESSKGLSVVVHQNEERRISGLGAKIENGYIIQDHRGLCPFKSNAGLCTIHDQKPLGCKASPFTFNDNRTLIVRNRYRLLKCYKSAIEPAPAYAAHRWSLIAIFGEDIASKICREAKEGKDAIYADMEQNVFDILWGNHNKRNNKSLDSLTDKENNMKKKGLNLYGTDLFGEAITPAKGIISQKFTLPPFSVLNAREGNWQSRKKRWLKTGIKSEIGRGASPGGSARPACDYSKNERGDGAGKPLAQTFTATNWMRKKGLTGGCSDGDPAVASGTSLFDPVLCELMYSWFCPPSGQIIDPFAGGSVRGIVAHLMGFIYWGCDLSPQQIEANRIQAEDILGNDNAQHPEWINGDSLRYIKKAPEADFLFSCPPYGDLEVYSNNPNDISNMPYADFLSAYQKIIHKSVSKLRENRFACFCVANFRNKDGFFNDLVSDTIQAFNDAGCAYYNELILITAVGSLPIRITKQFELSRKIGKTHQNVLIFIKGDPKKATEEITKGE